MLSSKCFTLVKILRHLVNFLTADEVILFLRTFNQNLMKKKKLREPSNVQTQSRNVWVELRQNFNQNRIILSQLPSRDNLKVLFYKMKE